VSLFHLAVFPTGHVTGLTRPAVLSSVTYGLVLEKEKA